MTNCPNGCGQEVVIKRHEGTNEKLIYLPGGEVPHKCKGKEYYCDKCKKKYPVTKLCFHRSQNFPGYKKQGLDFHF